MNSYPFACLCLWSARVQGVHHSYLAHTFEKKCLVLKTAFQVLSQTALVAPMGPRLASYSRYPSCPSCLCSGNTDVRIHSRPLVLTKPIQPAHFSSLKYQNSSSKTPTTSPAPRSHARPSPSATHFFQLSPHHKNLILDF